MPRIQVGNDVTVHSANLCQSSLEFQDVSLKFHRSVKGSVVISSIERIQNPHLYQTYQLRKEKMDKDNGGDNERQLFHGTIPENVVLINTQGFNRSFSGVNGKNFLACLVPRSYRVTAWPLRIPWFQPKGRSYHSGLVPCAMT